MIKEIIYFTSLTTAMEDVRFGQERTEIVYCILVFEIDSDKNRVENRQTFT